MRFLAIIFLSLMVRYVISLQGLYSAEVSILGEGETPSDTKPLVTCTISTIEPVGTDVKFAKYIASSEEVDAKSSSWRDNSTAQTFEECADATAASGGKMFLFDEQRCQISDDVFMKTDQCTKDHSQMVYMDVEAVPEDNTISIFCNIDWTVSCETGKCINNLVKTGDNCNKEMYDVKSYEGLYHIIDSNYKVPMSDHYAECEAFGAQPCAPANEESIPQFMNHLNDLVTMFTIGLNSTDGGNSYKWATGVPMPKNHSAWISSETFNYMCGIKSPNKKTKTTDCQLSKYFCCMVPYYAN